MTPSRAFFCLVLAALAALTACGSGGPGQTPAPSASLKPSGTLIPSYHGQELAHAEQLYGDGSFEDGIAEFEVVAHRGSAGAQLEASFRLAQIYYQRGEADQSVKLLNTYLATDGLDPIRKRAAVLLLGSAQLATGDLGAAEAAFLEYIDTQGPATPYAKLRLAELRAGLEAYGDSVKFTREALAEGLPPSVARDARFSLADHLEQAGDNEAALAEYAALSTEAPDDTSKGEALWRLADVALSEHDSRRSTDALHQLIATYPWHEKALWALDEPQLSLAPPSASERARVYFEHSENDSATALYTSILDGTPVFEEAGTAHYYLGALADRAGDYDAAQAHYQAAVQMLQGSNLSLQGEALWERARDLELLGQADEAIAAFVAVADQAPFTQHVADALFTAGWLSDAAGQPALALDYWLRSADAATEASDVARARFWAAQAADAIGDPEAAQAQLSLAVQDAPLDFYGMRAAAELAGETEFPVPAEITPAATDFATIEAWITAAFWGEGLGSGDALWWGGLNRGLKLHKAGLEADANAEFDAALDSAHNDPWLLYHLARTAEEAGLLPLQTRAASALGHLAPNPPAELFRLVYPVPYAATVNSEADASGVPAALLLALMRQESLYTPDAGSPAGAQGLMQIVPSTGENIAKQLGVSPYTPLDLLRPSISIKFGAYFLGTQLDGFGRRPEAALAAYNGGPGNAGRWLDAAGGDRDVFIEAIDYSETRAYVELVLENYALYLWAYGQASTPAIPFK